MKTIVRVLIVVVIILIVAVFGYKIYIAHTASISNAVKNSNKTENEDSKAS